MPKGLSNVERLVATLNGTKADRVPNFEILIDNRATRHILNLPTAGDRITLWTLPPDQAVELVRRIGQDAIACSMTWNLDERWGHIQSHADADSLAPPDPGEARAKLADYLQAVADTPVGMVARVSGPMTLAYMALGPVPIESFMMMLYDQPDLVERVMDIFLDYHLKVIEAIADLPFDLFYIGDDISSSTGPMISPKDLERFWAPRTERLIRAALATGRPIIFHCCGQLAPILPYLARWGVQAVHPIQPVANDIYAIRAEYPRLTLVGNIDVDSVLSRGKPEQVRADVREHIDRLAGDGRYVVCSSHSIIDSVVPENFLAMVSETHEYGVYA
ncbi:MAG TPA: uroporphyrinogen decarboxylase family protein [Phycisphaerae bacterium]|nr:uroporphyrinogen decarboxylase family protein [Phycisphaerae bacterium]